MNLKMNLSKSTTLSSVLLIFALLNGVALAQERPSGYTDDLYHCDDPNNLKNPISCDSTTHRWKFETLDPTVKPDDSLLCQEVVSILVRAREQESAQSALIQMEQTQKELELWEQIMETSVVDQLEPCILWAIAYGPLKPWATSMGFGEYQYHSQHSHVDIKDNSDPISSMLETKFDPIVIALAWDTVLPEPLSLDRTELHELTGRHMLDVLRAELGPDKVVHLDLTVTAGLPDYGARILPLTLSGKVVFGDHREALGPSTLHKVILKTTFNDDNARDLYLFRLKIAEDSTLQTVYGIVAGSENVAMYILSQKNDSEEYNQRKENYGAEHDQKNKRNDTDLSEDDEGFVSVLLVAILSAVGAAIFAVVCFAYCLLCRSRTSGKAAKTLEEHSSSDGSYSQSKSEAKGFKQDPKSFHDAVPAVKTAPTEEAAEDEDEYDIEYVAGSHVDDGISEYDMDTLPPPSSLPDSDDCDNSIEMSVMEGFEDENVAYEEEDAATAAAATNIQSDDSATNTSLYDYIPDDTSLSKSIEKEPTILEKVSEKGILWSVMNETPAPSDSDVEDYDSNAPSAEPRTSILGPSDDNDAQSHDSDSLLYGNDDDENQGPLTSHKITEMPLDYSNDEERPPPNQDLGQQQPFVESSSSGAEPGDKRKKFEDLWKDENEIDEAASVLNYLDSVQSARRAAESGIEANALPTTSIKIVDVATPIQTPERPLRAENESLVDIVPVTDGTQAADDLMNLPLPATLDSNFQDTASVSSSLSGSSSRNSQHRRVAGESARLKKSSNWNSSNHSVRSSGSSVCSTDSSKLRSLLGQGDTNDAAIIFGKTPSIQPNKDDRSMSSGNSNSTNDADVSMSSCTSGKLKSLLTTDSKDANSDDEPEDFLFTSNPTSEPRRSHEEEKKDIDYDDDDADDRKNSYLPTSMQSPRGPTPPMNVEASPDDATVYSSFSEAPSVDESINSGMGWF